MKVPETNTEDIGTRPQTNVDASREDVEDTYKLHPSAYPGNGAVDYIDSMNIEEVDTKAEEQPEKCNTQQLGEPITAAMLPLAEDILPRNFVDAGEGDPFIQLSNSVASKSKSDFTVQNVVLRKLLRGWRYFDCGDEPSHLECHAANSAVRKWRKACYICGDLQHSGKKCRKRRTCFICNIRGHIARNCPKSDEAYVDICLRCGESGHDLFSCNNDYSSDDLKNIQCYVCNKVGHICCDNYTGISPATVSCCNCGESGHSGSECPKPHLDKRGSQPPSICYKCGEEGHVARKCMKNAEGKGHIAQKCVNSPEGELLHPMSSQLDQDKLTTEGSVEEPNDDALHQSRKTARRKKTYRYRRLQKRNTSELVECVTGQ